MAKRLKFGELIAASKDYPLATVAEWIQAGVEPAVLSSIAIIERAEWRKSHGRHRPRCGAHARSTGRPCKAKAVPGRTRCKLHGGSSTGPKTPEGRRIVAELARARMREYWRKRRRTGNAADS